MNVRRQPNTLVEWEVQMLSSLSRGQSVKAIGLDLGKTEQTVSTRLRRLMGVTGAANHFQLGAWYENAKRLHIALGGE